MLKSSEQIKEYWNVFSNFYSNNLEYIYLQNGINLARFLNVSNAKDVIEIGCGSGLLSLHWLSILSKDVKYTSIDLSNDMIACAEKRKEVFALKINELDHKFICYNAENLDFVSDGSIDVFYGNLVIHLADNPNAILKEAKRVLRPGGRIGFTVLGTTEETSFFNIAVNALKKNGYEVVAKSSGLPLNDTESLLKLFKENELETDFCWTETIAYDIYDDEGLDKILKQPKIMKTIEDLDELVRKNVIKDVKNTFRELKKNKLPLTAKIVYITGRKQP